MPGETFRLRAELAALAPFNARVRGHLAAGPPPPDATRDAALFLLLDELLTNIIKYGYPVGDGASHEIEVRLGLEAAGFVVDVEDDGVPFDPTAIPVRAPAADDLPLEDRPVGGWGLELVRQTVDVAHYRRDGSKNKLTLSKSFVAAAGSRGG